MSSRLEVGQPAPGFEAAGTGSRTYSLSSYEGNEVVLVFYPGDATPVCTEQLKSYSRELDQFESLGAQVLALSPQSVESHEKFLAANGFRFPLLFDEGKHIGELYGIVGPLGFYRRSVFVIGADGVIRFVKRSGPGFSYPSVEEIVGALKE